jgi:sugar-specific transcriptional regulator TrmB
MNRSLKPRAVIYLVAIFIAGMLAGGAVGYSYGKRQPFFPRQPEEMAAKIKTHLQSRLKLMPEQMEKIGPIVEQTTQEIYRTHGDSMRQVGELVKKSNERIAQVLTLEQQQELKAMEQEREKAMRKMLKQDNQKKD